MREGPQILAVRARVAVAEGERDTARAPANPVLEVAREQVFLAGGPADQQRVALTAEAPLGVRQARVAVADQGLAVAKVRVRLAVVHLVQAFRADFTATRLAECRLALLERALARLDAMLLVLERRKAAGEVAGFDVLRVRLARVELVANLEDARQAAETGRARLTGWLGRPVDHPLVAQAGREPPPLAALKAQQRARHPELQAFGAELSRARAELALARRRALADPQLTFGLKQTNEPTVQGFGYAAGLSWPLPVPGLSQAAVAAAEAEVARLESESQAVGLRLEAELVAARSACARRRAQRTAHARATAPMAARVVETAARAYGEGAVDITTLLDAHRAGLAAGEQLLRLEEQEEAAWRELDRVVGMEGEDVP
jgi:outer membrane protein TolC